MGNAVELQVNVSIKGRQLDSLKFQAGEIRIGREPGSDIFLDNPGVSRQHARIEISDQGIEIVDTQSGNGTFVNEQQIQRSPLKNGDSVRIGKFTLDMTVSRAAQTETAAAPAAESGEPVDEADQTVFLQAGEQAKIQSESRQAERGVPPASSTSSSRTRDADKPPLDMKTLVMGVIVGGFIVWLLMS